MVFCNVATSFRKSEVRTVTILILIDGFLQLIYKNIQHTSTNCHNPYFNRWFSAMYLEITYQNNNFVVTILILIDGFLQYCVAFYCGWFEVVTILILIDGFLQ